MINFILVFLIGTLLGLVIGYIYKSKKRGVKCIGCPDAANCSGSCGSCPGCGK